MKHLSDRARKLIQHRPETMRAIDEALERGTVPCVKCREEIPLGVRVCPQCGHEFRPPWWKQRWLLYCALAFPTLMLTALGALWWLNRLPTCHSPDAQLKLAEAFRFSDLPDQLGGLPQDMLYIREHPDDPPPETRLCYGVMLLSNNQEVDLDYQVVRDESGFLKVTFSLK